MRERVIANFAVVVGALGSGACAASTLRREAPAVIPDTGIVAQVAAVARDLAQVRVDVDPERLPPALEGPGAVPARREILSGSAYAELREIIRTAVRAATPEERDHCWGLVPDDSVGSQHSGCPKTPHLLLVVGSPRRDSVALAKMARRNPEEIKDYWWVRVIETVFSSSGSGITLADYVFDKKGGIWRFVFRSPVFSFD